MSRVRKEDEYNLKKKQIVLHAVDLLEKEGFEKFSVNKVIKNADMTKGAFFHYFESKNELIEEIVNLILVPLSEAFQEIANDMNIEPKDKIKILFDVASKFKSTDKRTTQQLIGLLHKKENQSIMQIITDNTILCLLPIYEKIMQDGNKKGQFNISYPNGSAFMFLNTITAINKEIGDVLYKETIDKEQYQKLKEKIYAFEQFSKVLFEFNKDTNLFDENLLKIDLKKL